MKFENNEDEVEVIDFDYYNEISINDLIFAIDKSKSFSLYSINEEDSVETGEKNILIKIKKRNKNNKEK